MTKYNIMKNDRIIFRGISRKSINQYYPNLLVTSRNKYLGYSSYSLTLLLKNNKKLLHGFYLERSNEKFDMLLDDRKIKERLKDAI